MVEKKIDSIPPSKLIILQGDDRLSIEGKIAEISSRFGNQEFLGFNTVRLDGAILDFKKISIQLNAFPLGEGKRIVILENAIDSIGSKGAQEWLKNIIIKGPLTTLFILVIEDEKKYFKGSMVWSKITSKHWLKKLSKEYANDIFWIENSLPTEREMPEWILESAKELGGEFNPQAAFELARMVSNDLFQARQEIEKAILYVGSEREVEIDDVRLLCAASQTEKIFALVDAFGMRNGKQAIGILNKLCKDMPIQYLFSMLVRQFRLLILAKEAILHNGGEKDVLTACGIKHVFLAKKLINQSGRFSIKELENTYRKLDIIDEGVKTGLFSLEATLDSLVAEVSL